MRHRRPEFDVSDLYRPFWFGLGVKLLVLLMIFGGAAQAFAQDKYDPEHPDVQKLIREGLEFVVANNRTSLPGPRIMYGMAAYKSQVVTSPNPKEHPLIDSALEAIKLWCTESKLAGSAEFNKMYASALACIFLLEIDADAYRNEIEILLDHILERQQDSGGWGYRDEPTIGDVSQMQYIALALWLADEKGFKVSYRAAKEGLAWMLEFQESNGGWNYKYPPVYGAMAGYNNTVRPSLVAAGLGTVYLYADLLRLKARGGNLGPKVTEDMDLPPDVVDVTNEDDPGAVKDKNGPRVSFDRGALLRGMNNGNRWFQSNFEPETEDHNMYFLYGFERYAALREYLDGNVNGVEDWYDEGVDFLKTIQGSNGALAVSNGEPAEIQTCLAILFLTRSMSITIADKASGVLPGGKGFPTDVILKERGDKIIGGMVERSVTDMLQLLENPDQDQWELYLNSLDELEMEGDSVSRNEQLATLRGLVTHEDYQARLIAIKFLSKKRTLDNAPAFIYALTDPDERVVFEANEALRFLSRKIEVPRIAKGRAPSRNELKELKRVWKEWFLKVKPDGILLQEPEEDK